MRKRNRSADRLQGKEGREDALANDVELRLQSIQELMQTGSDSIVDMGVGSLRPELPQMLLLQQFVFSPALCVSTSTLRTTRARPSLSKQITYDIKELARTVHELKDRHVLCFAPGPDRR
jgi:hypothetical protein